MEKLLKLQTKLSPKLNRFTSSTVRRKASVIRFHVGAAESKWFKWMIAVSSMYSLVEMLLLIVSTVSKTTIRRRLWTVFWWIFTKEVPSNKTGCCMRSVNKCRHNRYQSGSKIVNKTKWKQNHTQNSQKSTCLSIRVKHKTLFLSLLRPNPNSNPNSNPNPNQLTLWH